MFYLLISLNLQLSELHISPRKVIALIILIFVVTEIPLILFNLAFFP